MRSTWKKLICEFIRKQVWPRKFILETFIRSHEIFSCLSRLFFYHSSNMFSKYGNHALSLLSSAEASSIFYLEWGLIVHSKLARLHRGEGPVPKTPSKIVQNYERVANWTQNEWIESKVPEILMIDKRQ